MMVYIIKKIRFKYGECVAQSRRLPTAIVCVILLKMIDVARLTPRVVGILSDCW